MSEPELPLTRPVAALSSVEFGGLLCVTAMLNELGNRSREQMYRGADRF